MTSRTNRHSGGRNQGDPGEVAPSDLEQRRQLAVERYLAGDPIAVICQEMGCAKSWLYKWKHRYQATEPAWFTARSRRPETTPSSPWKIGIEKPGFPSERHHGMCRGVRWSLLWSITVALSPHAPHENVPLER